MADKDGLEPYGITDAMAKELRETIGPMEDERMKLTLAEKERALVIKTAVEADHRLAKLTDFEYVQYALTTSGEGMERICERVYMMQCFRQEYKLDDHVLQGAELFYQLTVLLPGLMLAVEYLPTSDNYISIVDNAAFIPSQIKSYDDNRAFFGGIYYEYQCRTPNFRSIRNGMSWMTECMGSNLSNFDPKFLEKMMVELIANYPMNVKELFFLNSDTLANVMYAVWKRFLPLHVQMAIQLGHQIAGLEGQRIDTIYTCPTPEEARDRMVLRVHRYLNIRYHNQLQFSLDKAAIVDPALV